MAKWQRIGGLQEDDANDTEGNVDDKAVDVGNSSSEYSDYDYFDDFLPEDLADINLPEGAFAIPDFSAGENNNNASSDVSYTPDTANNKEHLNHSTVAINEADEDQTTTQLPTTSRKLSTTLHPETESTTDYKKETEETTTTKNGLQLNRRRYRCRLNGWYPRVTDGPLQTLDKRCIRLLCGLNRNNKPRLEVQALLDCKCADK